MIRDARYAPVLRAFKAQACLALAAIRHRPAGTGRAAGRNGDRRCGPLSFFLPASVLLALAAPASAADADGERARIALRNIPSACSEEAARFCPWHGVSDQGPRALMICLRPNRTSFSPGCRKNVDMASGKG